MGTMVRKKRDGARSHSMFFAHEQELPIGRWGRAYGSPLWY